MFKTRNSIIVITFVFFFTLILVLLSNKPVPIKEQTIPDSTPKDYIIADVKDLEISASGGVVSLGGEGSEMVLPIHIGLDQAHVLARIMNNMSSKRPMTHDLLEEILEKSGSNVEYISVDKLESGTYHATIIVRDGELTSLDARPSDSIILALKLGAPIYIKKELLDLNGVSPRHKEMEMEMARSA